MASVRTPSFQKLSFRKFPQLSEAKNAVEEKYWSKYKIGLTLKESTTAVHFSPSSPHDYAITCGAKVQLYSSFDNEIVKTFTQFKEAAYCGRFRKDGKLLVTGGEEGTVQVFDIQSRSALRRLKKHTKPVHCVDFTTDGLGLLSGSDDGSLITWDLSQGAPLNTFSGHKDYLRCCVAQPNSKTLYVSGSYDHTLRLWDSQSGECVGVMDHGAPVECILPFSNGTSVISSGGNMVKVWDVMGSRSPIAAFSNRQKTVMSLCFDGQQQKLLSGGLDKQVKVYSLADYTVMHSMSYPAPVTAVAVSPDDSHLVVAMTEQIVSVKRKTKPGFIEQDEDEGVGMSVLFSSKPSNKTRPLKRSLQKRNESAIVVPSGKVKKLKSHDVLLKNFEYRKALNETLHPRHRGNTHLVYNTLQELIRRDGLKIALSGRTEEELVPLLQFIIKNFSDPQQTSLLCDVSSMIIDMFGSLVKEGNRLDALMKKLKLKADVEMKIRRELFEIKGILGTIAAINRTKAVHA